MIKTRTEIVSIDQETLVDFFSAAFYGSCWLSADYNRSEYMNSEPNEDNDCWEDKLAKVLLHGYSIKVCDCYAEDKDDFYGTLPHEWDDDDECMVYTVTLDDIKRGVANACDNGCAFDKQCVKDLINIEEGDLDNPEAEQLMQWVIFGKPIYG